MLRRIELEILAILKPGNTIAELATELDYSESYLSRAIADLGEKSLVHTERDGRRKRIAPSDAKAVEMYLDLVRQYSHIEFPELLTGKALEVLYHLDQPRSVSEIAEQSDNYRNTVNRILKRLRNRALVVTRDGRYSFNGDFERLNEFARELCHHLHRQRLEAVAPNGTILWENFDEFLAQTETEIDADSFEETGLARFAAFDLKFFLTSQRYYYYSEEKRDISVAELCCHTLVIENGTRHRSYCLLLLSRVDIGEDDLREQAAKYGLEKTIAALLRYLDTNGEVDAVHLPSWEEFQKLATEYDVTPPE